MWGSRNLLLLRSSDSVPDLGLIGETFNNKEGIEIMKRPTSITVVAWFIIVTSGISLLATPLSLNNPMAQELMAKNPLPISLQIAMAYLGLTISIVSGIGMLKAQNWARLLYVIWGGFGFVVGVFTSPVKLMMIPGLVILAIIAFFLFQPSANKYFSIKEAASDPQDA